MLPRYGQVRNEICAPRRAQSAAASTTAVTLRRRYLYRNYTPTDGRWTRRDPIGIEGGWSMYAYVGNFVYGSVDILGKKKCNCWLLKENMMQLRIGLHSIVLNRNINLSLLHLNMLTVMERSI